METFVITKPSDAIRAREIARKMAKSLGFGLVDQTEIAFTISEFAITMLSAGERCRVEIDMFGGSEEGKAGIEVAMYEHSARFKHNDASWASQFVDSLDVSQSCADEFVVTFRKCLSVCMDGSFPDTLPASAAGEDF